MGVKPTDAKVLWNPKRNVPKPEKSENRVMVVATVNGETITHELISDVLDIMTTPKNKKNYGVVWALVVARDSEEAKKVWSAFLSSPKKVVFGEVLLPERLAQC